MRERVERTLKDLLRIPNRPPRRGLTGIGDDLPEEFAVDEVGQPSQHEPERRDHRAHIHHMHRGTHADSVPMLILEPLADPPAREHHAEEPAVGGHPAVGQAQRPPPRRGR